MAWEDQGRQEHGYFGDGKGPEKPKDGGMFAPNAVTDRMTAVIHASVAALPNKSRGFSAAQLNDARTKDLAVAMTKWSKAGSLPKSDFAAAFFDRDGDDPVVVLLREAAETAASAKSQADLRDASTLLAEAEQKIGLGHWRGFVDDAVKRGCNSGNSLGRRARRQRMLLRPGLVRPRRRQRMGTLAGRPSWQPARPRLEIQGARVISNDSLILSIGRPAI
jgi:hypothetical protein